MVSDSVGLVVIALTTVSLIVTDQRFDAEQRVRRKYGVDRHYWIPIVGVLLAFGAGLVEPSAVGSAISRLDILVLVVVLAFFAEALRATGLFRHAALRLVKWADGSVSRLFLGVYALTGTLTLATSNDIVILALTPVLVEVVALTDIEDARLLFLGQFIAANTFSAGLLIGSPTNLIVGDRLGISFVEYAILMLPPTLIVGIASLGVIGVALYRGWLVSASTYSISDNIELPRTTQMRTSSVLFVCFAFLIAVVTHFGWSLYWAAIPGLVVVLLYWGTRVDEPLKQPVARLPYGLIFFGFSFFVLGTSFGTTSIAQEAAGAVAAGTTGAVRQGITLVVTVLFVNMFNDLPASVILAEMAAGIPIDGLSRIAVLQSLLIGLNVGKYLTQAGALAGLLWFRVLRSESRQHETTIQTPSPRTLFMFGVVNVVVVTVVLLLFLAVELRILSVV